MVEGVLALSASPVLTLSLSLSPNIMLSLSRVQGQLPTLGQHAGLPMEQSVVKPWPGFIKLYFGTKLCLSMCINGSSKIYCWVNHAMD